MSDECSGEPNSEGSEPSDSFAVWVASLAKEQYDGMRWTDDVRLGWETTSALQLVAHGRRILLAERRIDDEIEALFAVLALGIERLLKVAIGHAHLRNRKGWPGHVGQAQGHRIAAIHRDLLKKVERGIPGGTYPDAVRAALRRVREDRVLAALFEALESFATGGRYQGLDGLAGVEGRGEGAFDGFVGVVAVVEEVDPSPEGLDELEFLAHASRLIETSLRDWLASLRLFASNDTLGLRARSLAAHIHQAETTIGERLE